MADREESYLAWLATLLRFQSISGEEHGGDTEAAKQAFKRMWRFLENECDRQGLTLRVHEDEGAVIEWPGSDPNAPTLGIACHLDVVPVDDDWTHPPFGGTIAEGCVWGRGAQDDKGPVAMVLSAFDVLQRLGFQPKGTVCVWLGTREETTDWPDMDLLLARERIPDRVIVPDGAFPLAVGEKGIVTVEWSARWGPEGGDDAMLRFHGLEAGERSNVVPGHGLLTLSAPEAQADDVAAELEETNLKLCRISPQAEAKVIRRNDDEKPRRTQFTIDQVRGRTQFTVDFHGHAAHAAIPHDGHNAALDALAFMTLMPHLDNKAQRFAGFLYDHCRSLDASGVHLAHKHAQLGQTTLNLGRVVMQDGGAQALSNVRFPLGLTTDDVRKRFQQVATEAIDVDLQVHTQLVGRPQEPFLLDTEEHAAFLEPLAAAYEAVTGEKAETLTIAGTTYAKLFPVAVGYGPVDLQRHEPVLVHQADERVSVDRHLENIRIYALAIALLTKQGSDGSGP